MLPIKGSIGINHVKFLPKLFVLDNLLQKKLIDILYHLMHLLVHLIVKVVDWLLFFTFSLS